MKRTRGDTLTGGTGDVNPQQLIFPGMTLVGANTYSQQIINLPVSQLPVKNGKAIVMEILKIYWDLPTFGSNMPAGDTNWICQAQLSTASSNGINTSAPQIFAYVKRKSKGQEGGAASSYYTTWTEPEIQDYTDGAGHGMLVATNSIFMGANTSNFTASVSFGCRILYRWKEVGLTEYLGMVQQQQQNAGPAT
jgi:hypothetical protein